MNLKVKKRFVDKESGVMYALGSLYETDKQERANELIGKGFLEGEIKKLKKEKADKK